MPSRNAAVAEAVKVALNAAAATLSPADPFVAKRVYAPTVPLADAKALQVTVWAPGDEREQLARARSSYEIPVVVAVEKRLKRSCDPAEETANAEIDPLMELVERAADHFQPGPLGDTGASFVRAATNLQDPDVMRAQRMFLALVTLTFVKHS